MPAGFNETLELNKAQTHEQLMSRIKRLEREKKELSETIVTLEAQLEGEDVADLKKEIANLKRSNTMLKKNQTS
jgi:uncharacterized protein (UPF0335 family)